MPNNNNNNATRKEYLQHNRYCRTFGQTSPKHMEQVIAFVFASIRTQTFLLPKLMKEWRKRGIKSSWIWGNKKNGIAYIRKNRTNLYNRMMSIIKAKKAFMQHDLIMLFLEVPGLGIPKSAFVVQLLTGMSGCMDVHNIRKYLPEADASKGTPSMLQTSGNSEAIKIKKVHEYQELVKKAGGSQSMWIDWCNHIAVLQPKYFNGGKDVSKLHQECIR